MLAIVLAILPIFALLVLGHMLRRNGIPSDEFWGLNDRLVYWVLFPALLFSKTATHGLGGDLAGPLAGVLAAGLVIATGVGWLLARVSGLAPPAASSVVQGAMRNNTFLSLAIAERLFGSDGLTIAALCAAVIVPATNVAVVAALSLMLADGGRGLGRRLARDLVRNPLIVSVLAGLAVNRMGGADWPVLVPMADILGRAALPIVLLCIGASIRLGDVGAAVAPTALAVVSKMLVYPLVVLAIGLAVGLPPLALAIALLFGAGPTAPASYSLARQMGGDAPLMAAIITLQTALSLLTLPLTLWAAGTLGWVLAGG